MSNDLHGHALSIAEQATGQYPILDIRDAFEASAQHRLATAPPKASLALARLENEINALRASWEVVTTEHASREACIADLAAEIESSDAANARLTADLEREAAARVAAHERLASQDAAIAALTEDQRKRDEKIAALSTELVGSETERNELLERLAHADAACARLGEALRDGQTAAAAAAKANEELLGEQTRLNSQIHDLEVYIDGRNDQWSGINAELAAHKETIWGLEAALEERDAAAARHAEEKAALVARASELESELETLRGRLAEREVARATTTAASSQMRINALELRLKQRNESIDELNAEIERGAAALTELIAERDHFEKRIVALERAVTERLEQIRLLGDELRVAQQSLSEKTTQLVASQEALERESHRSQGLTDDLSGTQNAAAQLRMEIERLEKLSAEREQQRADAVAEAEQLQLEVAAQLARIEHLENHGEQAAQELLERSVVRITGLGASLATVGQRRSADAPADSTQDAGDSSSPEAPAEAARRLTATVGGQPVSYPIDRDVMTIGRDQTSDIRIVSHYVSRLHAKIRTNDGETIIEDAGSKNGVLVNSQRVRTRVLRDGDVVSIAGEHDFRFFESAMG